MKNSIGIVDDEAANEWPLEHGSVSALAPHKAEPEILSLSRVSAPTILLSLEAYSDTHYIMEAAGQDEIGWLGTVKVLDDNTYLIERVFLFHQRVSAMHCEFDQESIGAFYMDMLKKSPANKDVLNSIKFWGHLHPGRMTEPSGQDDDQMELFAHNPFFIRGIFTREGKCVFDFFDYANKIKIIDCPWNISFGNEARRTELANEIAVKVTGSSFHDGIRSKGGKNGRNKK